MLRLTKDHLLDPVTAGHHAPHRRVVVMPVCAVSWPGITFEIESTYTFDPFLNSPFYPNRPPQIRSLPQIIYYLNHVDL